MSVPLALVLSSFEVTLNGRLFMCLLQPVVSLCLLRLSPQGVSRSAARVAGAFLPSAKMTLGGLLRLLCKCQTNSSWPTRSQGRPVVWMFGYPRLHVQQESKCREFPLAT